MSERKGFMDAYVVFTNTDLTEGRGSQYPLAVCKLEATAIRKAAKAYVQGTDAPYEQCELILHKGRWYGPIHLIEPSREDEAAQKRLDAQAAAVKKAKEAGLTDEDIKDMRG